MTDAGPLVRPPQTDRRDAYIDFLRAFSVVVIVFWHWAFTIIRWNPMTGPTAHSPVGLTPGFWVVTWVCQATPVLFYVGGYAHLRSWNRAQGDGVRLAAFVGRRLRQLALPGIGVLTFVLLLELAGWTFGVVWAARVVRLVVSPMWFLGVYLALIALLPLTLWLHRRFGLVAVAWLAGLALLVDILRFWYHVDHAAWANLLIVWGLAHQAGFSHSTIVARRRRGWVLVAAGMVGLAVMIAWAGYPASMIGVVGERFSNMAPPTFAVVALAAIQIGAAAAARPALTSLLPRPGWVAVIGMINQYALPLFLVHATGMAIWRCIVLLFGGDLQDDLPPTLAWWLGRPLAVLGALAGTTPLIWLYGRLRARRRQAVSPPLPVRSIPRSRVSTETERSLPAAVVAQGEPADNAG